jgi:hypothetical protein
VFPFTKELLPLVAFVKMPDFLPRPAP